MRINLEIDTTAAGPREASVLAAIAAIIGGAVLPTAAAHPTPASDAAPASDTSAGATPATETTVEPLKSGRGGARKKADAASTPASGTSPGDVFSGQTGAAPAAKGAVTGDVFSQQIKDANAAADTQTAAAALAGDNPVWTREQVQDRVSAVLPTIKAKGLKEILSQFQTEDGATVTNMKELPEVDFVAFMEELSAF